MDEKRTTFAFPKAPLGEAARKAMDAFASPGVFAHHIPTGAAMRKPANPRMERPHGGEGPRNALER